MEYATIEEAQDDFVKKWAVSLSKKLGYEVTASPHHVAAAIINDPGTRNYMTASALIFGLSFISYKEYLDAACKKLKEDHEAQGCPDITPEWLSEYVAYYCAEVAEYPAGA